MPASTSSDSALRRMRVARWSSRNRLARVSASASLDLELGDEVELAAEQVLVAAAEVDEAVRDVAAEHGLLDGQVERGVLHGVEGVGDVGHLVAGLDHDRVDGGDLHVVAERGLQDVDDGLGQPALGHVLGLAGERPQRLGDRPRHQPGDQRRRPSTASAARTMNQRCRASAADCSSSARSGERVGDPLAEHGVAERVGVVAGRVGDDVVEVGHGRRRWPRRPPRGSAAPPRRRRAPRPGARRCRSPWCR